jgi:hypothetical protein
MAKIQYDSSSDLESSGVLESTPVKEDHNKTLIVGLLASKKTQPHIPLSHSTLRYTGNESKSHATEKEYHSPKKGKELSMLRNSRSVQAHVSSDEESDEFTVYGRRHRRYAIESTDSETSQNRGNSPLDTPEEPLYSVKPTLKVGKHRQRRNVMFVSDSDGAVTEDEEEGLVVSNSPELLKPAPPEGSDKKKKCVIYSSDSDASDTPKKSMTAGKYRDCKLLESSDSESGSVDEKASSLSDSSSPITTPDKNAAVGTVLREAESSNEDGRSVLETSISGKFTVELKGLKSIQNVVELSDALVKTVEDDDDDSTVQIKEVSSSSLLN